MDGYTSALDPTSPVIGATVLFFLSDRFVHVVLSCFHSAASPCRFNFLFISHLPFLIDRDVKLSGASSPWGPRAPSPSFDGLSCLHVLPLQSLEDSLEENLVNAFVQAPYAGGGAIEVSMEGIKELELLLEMVESGQVITSDANATDSNVTASDSSTSSNQSIVNSGDNFTKPATEDHLYIVDTPISFGPEKDITYSFARTSYRMDSIPSGNYDLIVAQLSDDASLILLSSTPTGFELGIFATSDYPSDGVEKMPVVFEDGSLLQYVEVSTDGRYIITIFSERMKIVPTTAKGVIELFMKDAPLVKNIADIDGLHLSVWPALEFEQMYKDAWRMLRDYYYDSGMTSLEWDTVFDRYLPLVERCAKREELDDVLRQMAGELSALHVFVYGGEYNTPNHGDPFLEAINDVASLGAMLRRSVEKNGYEILKIPQIDPGMPCVDNDFVFLNVICFLLLTLLYYMSCFKISTCLMGFQGIPHFPVTLSD